MGSVHPASSFSRDHFCNMPTFPSPGLTGSEDMLPHAASEVFSCTCSTILSKSESCFVVYNSDQNHLRNSHMRHSLDRYFHMQLDHPHATFHLHVMHNLCIHPLPSQIKLRCQHPHIYPHSFLSHYVFWWFWRIIIILIR